MSLFFQKALSLSKNNYHHGSRINYSDKNNIKKPNDEDIKALTSYRQVHASGNITSYDEKLAKEGVFPLTNSGIKVFEKVPGADVKGSGAVPNSAVLASINLRENKTGNEFTYKQKVRADSDGNFTLTLPYSTEGYKKWGPKDGYSNPDVLPTGKWKIENEDKSIKIDVPESKVIGKDNSTSNISLNPNH